MLKYWVCLVLLAAATAVQPAPAFEDSMAQRTLACTGCHGKQGRAGPDGYYPRIAGKPAGHPADPAAAISPRVAQRGAKLYGDHCADCHGERGEGVPGAYPSLAGNRAVKLPPYATVLSDADLAAVLSHIRGSWGNQAPPVTELTVSQQRGNTAQ